jgi:polyketide cyclase/dehydrase/lipid transport protein
MIEHQCIGAVSMITVQVSGVINQPLTTVFAFIANPENHPQFETDFLEVQRLSAGANGVGSTYRYTQKMPGRVIESRLVMTEYLPEQKITLEGDWIGPLKPQGSYLCEAVDGGTKVTLVVQPQLRGLFKVLEPLMAYMVQRREQTLLRNLKGLLERR